MVCIEKNLCREDDFGFADGLGNGMLILSKMQAKCYNSINFNLAKGKKVSYALIRRVLLLFCELSG